MGDKRYKSKGRCDLDKCKHGEYLIVQEYGSIKETACTILLDSGILHIGKKSTIYIRGKDGYRSFVEWMDTHISLPPTSSWAAWFNEYENM